ncbi:MAG: potassium-transporting ATPase subunit C [Alphaproteobacteria bacterium]|nr:potassium-transporting ATPase subunit C [Alphaproteobacteria bacterium]
MKKDLLIAFSVSLITLFFTGVVYPFLITQIGGSLFPYKTSGSLIKDEQGGVIGSELLRQNFKNPAYFFPRPSAEETNLAPTSKLLITRIQARIAEIKKINTNPIPIDLVTSSASGLDPHISKEAALWQAPQIALHRNVNLKHITALIERLRESPQFYVLGESRLNVLKLNLALDVSFGVPVGGL